MNVNVTSKKPVLKKWSSTDFIPNEVPLTRPKNAILRKAKVFLRELKVDTVEQKTIYSDKKMFSTEIAVNNLNDGLYTKFTYFVVIDDSMRTVYCQKKSFYFIECDWSREILEIT